MKNIMSFETFEGSKYNPTLVRKIEDKLKERDKKFKKKRIVLSMPDFAMKDKKKDEKIDEGAVDKRSWIAKKVRSVDREMGDSYGDYDDVIDEVEERFEEKFGDVTNVDRNTIKEEVFSFYNMNWYEEDGEIYPKD